MKGVIHMFQHILVPLDGSSCAEQALPIAAKIARTTKARITLLRIQRLPVEYLSYIGAGGAMVYSEDMTSVDEKEAMEYLTRISQYAMLQSLVIDKEVVIGEAFPASTLIDSTQRHHVDLIVMCSHGNTGFKRFVLGSVAHQLVRYNIVPVLVLHQEKNAGPLVEKEPTSRPFNVLVTLDGTEAAEKALQPAAQLSAVLSVPMPGKLHLTRVAEPVENESEIVEDDVSQNDDAYDYLTRLKKQLDATEYMGHKLDTSVSILSSKHVAETLIKFVEQKDDQATLTIDAIALATHGRHGFARLLQGSITEQIMGHIKQPMLIIPQKADMEQKTQQKNTISPGIALL
jgi:nucleotide-binding universal stress UspA family protein